MTCTCGHDGDEHEVIHGSFAHCEIDGCECICFEHGEDDE